MKKILYITGLVLISLVTFSCSNDEDVYGNQEVKADALKSIPESTLNKTAKDSTKVNIPMQIAPQEGDPSNPRPPRQE
jgi:hypothetical protein